MKTFIDDDVRDRFLKNGISQQAVTMAVTAGKVIEASETILFESRVSRKCLRVLTKPVKIDGIKVLTVVRAYWQLEKKGA